MLQVFYCIGIVINVTAGLGYAWADYIYQSLKTIAIFLDFSYVLLIVSCAFYFDASRRLTQLAKADATFMLNVKETRIYLVSFICLSLSVIAIIIDYSKPLKEEVTLETSLFFVYAFFQFLE